MTKKELLQRVSEKTDSTQKSVEAIYDAIIETIVEDLNKEETIKVQVPNFGTLNVSVREAYSGVNPLTGEETDYPKKRMIRMSLSNNIKKQLIQDDFKKASKKKPSKDASKKVKTAKSSESKPTGKPSGKKIIKKKK